MCRCVIITTCLVTRIRCNLLQLISIYLYTAYIKELFVLLFCLFDAFRPIGSKLRPKVLQHVAVPVIENNVCENWHRRKGIDIRIYDEMMCAGYELGQRDACQVSLNQPNIGAIHIHILHDVNVCIKQILCI